MCVAEPDFFDLGPVTIGEAAETTFVVFNDGGGVLQGFVSEACGDYEILSGAGAYALESSETLFVRVRAQPSVTGSIPCGTSS